MNGTPATIARRTRKRKISEREKEEQREWEAKLTRKEKAELYKHEWPKYNKFYPDWWLEDYDAKKAAGKCACGFVRVCVCLM